MERPSRTPHGGRHPANRPRFFTPPAPHHTSPRRRSALTFPLPAVALHLSARLPWFRRGRPAHFLEKGCGARRLHQRATRNPSSRLPPPLNGRRTRARQKHPQQLPPRAHANGRSRNRNHSASRRQGRERRVPLPRGGARRGRWRRRRPAALLGALPVCCACAALKHERDAAGGRQSVLHITYGFYSV